MAEQHTHLTDAELAEFRHMLEEKHRELVGDYRALKDEAREQQGPEPTMTESNLPTHPADAALKNQNASRDMLLAQTERNLLVEVEAAIQRIDDGTYGICLATGEPISKARLRARPWARYSKEYAEKHEAA